jgi:hypothetical protein
MNPLPKFSIAILDFNRQKESRILLDSIKQNAKFPHEIIYLSNGGEQDYVLDYYKNGEIDRLILNQKGGGCGIGTRQLFQSCLSDWIFYVQVDQYLAAQIGEQGANSLVEFLEKNPDYFYVDLAGDQGRGNPSERASFFNRKRYLSMPKIDQIIGGPGPYADSQWTENYLQEYMKENNLKYLTGGNTYCFVDNGKVSRREYPCGGETIHYTDEKTLFIIKPLKQRYSFPNLNLTDSEWEEVLSGNWPKEGKIPEADKKHSFKVWN